MGEGMIARFNAWLDGVLDSGNDPAPEPQEPPQQPQPGQGEEYAALKEKAERAEKLEAELSEREQALEEYRAKMEKLEAEEKRAARISHFAAELEETAVAEDEDLHEALAGLDDEIAEPLVRRFKALSAQIDGSLEEDVGSSDDPKPDDENPAVQFNAAVAKKMKETEGLTYPQAFDMVRREQPDLARAATGGR